MNQIHKDNVEKEMLKSVFDAAFMEAEFDGDGDLQVRDEGIRCFVMPSADNKYIRLVSVFGPKEGASHSDLVSFANIVNDEFIIVRVSISKNNNAICFDHYIPVEGGIEPKTIVLHTKRFLGIPVQAIREHGENLIA